MGAGNSPRRAIAMTSGGGGAALTHRMGVRGASRKRGGDRVGLQDMPGPLLGPLCRD